MAPAQQRRNKNMRNRKKPSTIVFRDLPVTRIQPLGSAENVEKKAEKSKH